MKVVRNITILIPNWVIRLDEANINNPAAATYQHETISNLFYSGIPTEIISLQLGKKIPTKKKGY